MKRHEATTFDFTKDPDDMLLMTSHEESSFNKCISIHCTDDGLDGFSIYITPKQAKDLIGKLQEGIINLEVAKRTEFTKEEI